MVKSYGPIDGDNRQRLKDLNKRTIQGNPQKGRISTSLIERSNLTIRMGNRRFTRKTTGYSKKFLNHNHGLAVQLLHYNFCRKHMTLKTAPAVIAGLTASLMTFEGIVEMMDAYFKVKEERVFEDAFAAKELLARCSIQKAWDPRQPLTPWYHDPESGGPSPLAQFRKAGIKYQDE